MIYEGGEIEFGTLSRRTSGWGKKGPPQCPGCRRLLAQRGGWCPACLTYGGNHDHGGTR